MSRPKEGARLQLLRPKGRPAVWYIRDWIVDKDGNQIEIKRSTRCAEQDVGKANDALTAYLEEKLPHQPFADGPRPPDEALIEDVLNCYASAKEDAAVDPGRIVHAIKALQPFWQSLTVAAIRGETCRNYYRRRRDELTRKFPDRAAASPVSRVDNAGPACFDGTIRRELGCLARAISYCEQEGHLTAGKKVWLPPQPPGRDRWLTRKEVADLLRAARSRQRREARQYLPRFILLTLYTAARKYAALTVQWQPNFEGGHVDLDAAVIDFNPLQTTQTAKRRPRQKITRQLLGHLRRWRRLTRTHPIEVQPGERAKDQTPRPVADVKKGFAAAAKDAGLEGVTPHVLGHTAVTWLMQAGVSKEEASQYTGKSTKTIEQTYWHHHPDYQAEAVAAIEARGRPRDRRA